MNRPLRLVGLALALASLGLNAASACTGLTLRAKDGALVFGRTLEFGEDLKSQLLIVPRGHAFVGTNPDGSPGLRWKSRYGCVGMNAFGKPLIIDGLNEKGLHVGAFYFPGFASYQNVCGEDQERALAPVDVPNHLLTTCATTDEAIEAARAARVGDVLLKELGIVPPIHFIVTDATGKAAVLEYVQGSLKVHDNPLGVITNSPTFDWHMTNLSNYVNLSTTGTHMKDLAGVEVKPLGQGAGMLGLPGDFTPPSRFVRAVAYSRTARPSETARDAVTQAFHLLNQFDIPKGSIRAVEHGREVTDFTQWTSAADLTNGRYYVRTYDNSRIRRIDLKSVDLDAHSPKMIPVSGEESFEDVTPLGK